MNIFEKETSTPDVVAVNGFRDRVSRVWRKKRRLVVTVAVVGGLVLAGGVVAGVTLINPGLSSFACEVESTQLYDVPEGNDDDVAFLLVNTAECGTVAVYDPAPEGEVWEKKGFTYPGSDVRNVAGVQQDDFKTGDTYEFRLWDAGVNVPEHASAPLVADGVRTVEAYKLVE